MSTSMLIGIELLSAVIEAGVFKVDQRTMTRGRRRSEAPCSAVLQGPAIRPRYKWGKCKLPDTMERLTVLNVNIAGSASWL
jgi:hypothetical protein